MAMLNNQMVILRSPHETWQFSNPTPSWCNELCYQQRKQSGCCSTQTKTNSHCMPLPWKVTPSFYTKRVDVPKNGNMEGFSQIHDELVVWASDLETATPACEYERSDCKWLCPKIGMLQWQFQETKAVNIYKPLYLFYFIVLLSHLTVQTPRAPRALRFEWAHQWPPSARCQGTCLPRKRMKSQHHMVTAMVAG